MNTTIEKMTHATLRETLRVDGYAHLVDRAAEIMADARKGALLWSITRLTTTDTSRIDERPRRDYR